MADSEPLIDENGSNSGTKKTKKATQIISENDDDFPSMIRDFFRNINIKVALFLFFLGMIIFNDIFVNNVLSLVNGATYNESATNKGVIVQLLIFVLGYIIIDLLVQGGYL